MAVDSKIETLSTVALFTGCNKRELRSIAAQCSRLHVEKGFVLTTQGTPGRECFVIGEGEATVSIDGQPVSKVGPSDCVGEMSLLDGGERTATVIADGPMTLYSMSIAEFQSLLTNHPTIDRKIMAGLARRLRAAETGHVH